jgi:hypothetical protein
VPSACLFCGIRSCSISGCGQSAGGFAAKQVPIRTQSKGLLGTNPGQLRSLPSLPPNRLQKVLLDRRERRQPSNSRSRRYSPATHHRSARPVLGVHPSHKHLTLLLCTFRPSHSNKRHNLYNSFFYGHLARQSDGVRKLNEPRHPRDSLSNRFRYNGIVTGKMYTMMVRSY